MYIGSSTHQAHIIIIIRHGESSSFVSNQDERIRDLYECVRDQNSLHLKMIHTLTPLGWKNSCRKRSSIRAIQCYLVVLHT